MFVGRILRTESQGRGEMEGPVGGLWMWLGRTCRKLVVRKEDAEDRSGSTAK